MLKRYLDRDEQKDEILTLLHNVVLGDDDKNLLSYLHGYYTDYSVVMADRYQAPYNRKLEFFEPLLQGKSVGRFDFSHIDKRGYSVLMFEEITKWLRDYNRFVYFSSTPEELAKYFEEKETPEKIDNYKVDDIIFVNGRDLADHLEKTISHEDIMNNKISQEIKVGRRRFGKGGRVTRVLSALSDNLNISQLKNRFVGNMMSNGHVSSINISIHPLTGYLGGMMANSCLSPNGGNRHAGPNSIGYKNVAMLYNDDLTWRAWITFDFAAKIVGISKGYPKENYSIQYSLRKYFKDLGYRISQSHFRYPEYWDTSSTFSDDELEKFHGNHDAYYEYSVEETLTDIQGSEMFIPAFYSDYNDTWDFDPENEHNNDVYCEYEDDYHHEDEVGWSELLDSYMSDYGDDLFWERNGNYLIEAFAHSLTDYFENTERDADDERTTEEIRESLHDFATQHAHEINIYLLYDDCWNLSRALESKFPETQKERGSRVLAEYFWEWVSDYSFD